MDIKKKDIAYCRHQIEQELDDVKGSKEVLDLLFGHYNNDYSTDYKVVKRWYSSDTTVVNRLHMLWVFPTTLVCYPFQYILYGQCGWEEDGYIGGKILKLVGQNRNHK